MKEHIMVVGGYGHVGQMICRALGELYPGKVIAAGRSFDRAAQFSRATGGKVRPLQLDLSGQVDPDALADIKLVVMCLDQADTAFVRSCFESGTHYIDISASDSFLSQVEQLKADAAAHGATAVLSVGLAPGLTNLLALHARSLMDRVESIDISIMLGMGDQHGKAAIEWTVDNLSTDYQVVHQGAKKVVASFTDGRATNLGTGLGRRRAYRFNFSDQHTLARTLDVPTISTRLCFDSAVVTGMMAWLRASGMFRLLKFRLIRDALVQLLGKVRLGEATFAVKVDAWGETSQGKVLVECFLRGRQEAEATAKVAAAVADTVYRNSLRNGVYHIDQLFGLETILPSVQQAVSVETWVNGKRTP